MTYINIRRFLKAVTITQRFCLLWRRFSPLKEQPAFLGRHLAFIVVWLAAVVLGLAFLTSSDEPHFRGRSLSQWIDIAAQPSDLRPQAEGAVRSLGTNAIPTLLKWIRYEPPAWHPFARAKFGLLLHIAPGRWLLGESSYQNANRAIQGFFILKTNANCAVPDLAELFKDPARRKAAGRAMIVLYALGPPAFPQMVAALADTNHPYRDRVAPYFTFMAGVLGKSACLPPLQAALDDPDPRVRSAVTNALRSIAPEMFTSPLAR